MHVALARQHRRTIAPWWAVAIVAAWGAAVAAIGAVGAISGHGIMLCHFRRMTGFPCPTCGSTRAVLSLVQGEIARGLAFNPLAVVALAALICAAVVQLFTKRRVAVRMSRRERYLAWGLAVVALLANWAYVLSYHAG